MIIQLPFISMVQCQLSSHLLYQFAVNVTHFINCYTLNRMEERKYESIHESLWEQNINVTFWNVVMWIKQHSVLDKEEKLSFGLKFYHFLNMRTLVRAYSDAITNVLMIKRNLRKDTIWDDLHRCKWLHFKSQLFLMNRW